VGKYDIGGQATDNSIIQRMPFACWITKVTDTHRQYVILIDFPRQQWLRERVSILRYTPRKYQYSILLQPIPVAARSTVKVKVKVKVCGRSHVETVGSNPAGDMNVCLL